MQASVRNILLFSFCIVLQMVIVSCSSGEQEDIPLPPEGPVQIAIHISPVTTRAGNGSAIGDPKEMITSMRVIMIGTDEETKLDTVEFNRKIDVGVTGGIPATDFQYDFLWRTKKGPKKFFMIANEESVNNISYSGDQTADLTTLLTELLEKFEDNKPAGEYYDILQDIYFTPQYNTTGNIQLPYTSVYDVNVGEDYQEFSMYMVPVATKFIFNFTNNRDAAVWVKGISLSYANQSSYLLGKVGSKDSNKDLEGKSYYWVDWLAEVSKLSWENSSYYPNIDFNNKYGWITDYSLPLESTTNIPENYIFVGPEDAFQVLGILDGQTDEAGVYTAGPYYVPESKNYLNPTTNTPVESDEAGESGDSPLSQMYYLTINFEDSVEGKEAPEFENVAISNLKALFRNTCVIININMSQGDIEVYAEIAPWNVNQIQGWVTEGQDPGGL